MKGTFPFEAWENFRSEEEIQAFLEAGEQSDDPDVVEDARRIAAMAYSFLAHNQRRQT